MHTVLLHALSIACLYATSAPADNGKVPTRPEFPVRYRGSIVFSLPYIGLTMPIHIHHDGTQMKQTVEYFDGLSTEYISALEGLILFDVFNVTRRICINAVEDPETPTATVNIFPDLTQFNYTGLAVYKGLQCERWSRVLARPGEAEDFFWDPVLQRPIRWSMHSREEVFDSHVDDYSIDYISVHALDSFTSFQLPKACGADGSNAVSAHGDGAGPTTATSRLGSLIHYGRSLSARRRELSAKSDFVQYKTHYHRKFTSAEEEAKHKLHYEQSVSTVAELNAIHFGKTQFAVNQFADRSPPKGHRPPKERIAMQVYGNLPTKLEQVIDMHASLPSSWDWRDKGGSPPIKDQATCGSCWSFATIGAIEGQNMIVNGGHFQKLSEQFILDCAWSQGNAACMGGSESEAGRIVMGLYQGFLPLDEAYGSYLSTDSYCKRIDGMPGVRIDGWVAMPTFSHTDVVKRALVQYGPLAVSINAVPEILFYRGGVIQSDACKGTRLENLNHAVNLVGFGTAQDGTEYWILRNSWSPSWGELGYFKIEMGKRDCGVTASASFPVLKARADHSIVFPSSDEHGVNPVIIA